MSYPVPARGCKYLCMTNRCLALLALIVLPGISARLPAPRKTLSLRGGGVPTTGPVTVAVSAIQDAASGRGFFLCKDQCHFFLPFTGRGRKVLLAGLWAGALQFLLGLPCLLILPMWWCVPAMIRFSLVHAAAADQDVSTADAPSRSTDLARGHEHPRHRDPGREHPLQHYPGHEHPRRHRLDREQMTSRSRTA